MATVLFVCLHNAGRSQMSEALFERAADGRHGALSAGTTPAEHVHPRGRRGDARARHRPRPSAARALLTRELAERADVVVTMGCGDACPYIPGKRYVDWELPDPAGRPIAEVRATRDEIARRVDELLGELDAPDRSRRAAGVRRRPGRLACSGWQWPTATTSTSPTR